MIYPVNNYQLDWRVDQVFGNPTSYGFHEGVDLNLKTGGDTDLGQEIKSVTEGTIMYFHYNSHPSTGFGRHIVYEIRGDWGVRWCMYSHCDASGFQNQVQDVPEGRVIARLGKSGNSPTAHLHWSLFKVDPSTIGGIDTIAKTQQQLNDWWEDPIAFVEKWMKPQECIITDQTKIPQIDGMEVQAIRSKLTDQENAIRLMSDRLAQIHSISG